MTDDIGPTSTARNSELTAKAAEPESSLEQAAAKTRVKELLGIPEDYAIAALLPIGKPVKQLKKLTRRPVSEFATRERFDGAPL